ncbi:threonine/homoserine/homoserine lactone efflux protein [Microbacterium ginsengiterrae]|uniref:Threonine/homoserine/homoserine lactone efflux protein n=1 Tax=Microbacterium ginsengiterrae TaxID=546115 RepID=A0A7W9FAG3_9MICO|nr:threonine/homoserine/homoserine lactone efflux protein [Microbacterium ginsengiterrae]
MLAVLADLLTIGVAVAISPLAIVAVILMATSGKGRTNGTAFVLGCYVFAVAFVGVLVLIGRASGADDPDSGPHLFIDVVEIVLGLILLALAVVQWRKRSSTETPKWMSSLDDLSLAKAFLVGVLISGPLSPKDLPLLVAAGGRISQAALPTGEIVAVILIFGLLGVFAVAIPWVLSVLSPSQVEKKLAGPRTWLVANHAVIMTVLFVILGVKLMGSGIADLATAGGV